MDICEIDKEANVNDVVQCVLLIKSISGLAVCIILNHSDIAHGALKRITDSTDASCNLYGGLYAY